MMEKVAAHACDRPDLLMLPGMLCNEQSWAHQREALSSLASCTIVRYPLARARSLADMAAYALESAPSTFLLAGHSMGGRVAMEVLRLAPQRVAGLCLISTEHLPNPQGEAGQKETAGRLALLDLARRAGMPAVAQAWMPNLLPPHRLQDTALVGALSAMIASHTTEQLQAYIEAGVNRPDASTLLSAVTVPALLIGGTQDLVRPWRVMEEMGRIMGSSLHALDDCGHMPMMECPEKVSMLMRQWVVQCMAGPAPREYEPQS